METTENYTENVNSLFSDMFLKSAGPPDSI